MENQHRQIKGYRELTQAEIDGMNAVKAEGERLKLLIEELRDNPDLDTRWIDQAETHLQIGIMLAVRSIARPDSF